MKFSKYVSSLSLAVFQMVLLPVRGDFDDDSKFLFSPDIISGRLLSYLIVRWLDDSELAQIICTFFFPSFRLSKIYVYLSLRYDLKDD